MKKMWLALSLMVLVIITSTVSLLILTNMKNDFDKRFDELCIAAKSGDYTVAANTAEQLTEYWIKKHHTLCRIVRHTQLDQITLAIAKLEPLAEYGEQGELIAEIARCKLLFKEIWESELPTVTNIF